VSQQWPGGEGQQGQWQGTPGPSSAPPPGNAPPGYGVPPPGYGPPSYGAYQPQRRTSGLAIASLVLSILWLAGLGSLLAVIFGLSARKSIRRSHGQVSGGGMALAGLIIGIVGVIGAVAIAAAVAFAVSKYSTETNALGTTVQFSNNVDGLQSMAVYSITYPVSSGSDPGTELAVVDMKVCAGASGSQDGPGDFGLSLQFSGQNVYTAISPARKRPILDPSDGIAANRCERGFVTFEITDGSVPQALAYFAPSSHTYRWTLPPHG
jgi:hypothetical protein